MVLGILVYSILVSWNHSILVSLCIQNIQHACLLQRFALMFPFHAGDIFAGHIFWNYVLGKLVSLGKLGQRERERRHHSPFWDLQRERINTSFLFQRTFKLESKYSLSPSTCIVRVRHTYHLTHSPFTQDRHFNVTAQRIPPSRPEYTFLRKEWLHKHKFLYFFKSSSLWISNHFSFIYWTAHLSDA